MTTNVFKKRLTSPTMATCTTVQNAVEGKRLAPYAFRTTHIGAACFALMALSQSSYASQLLLSTIPAGSGGREPAPNVIITVDDSGSMAWDLTTDNYTSITANKKITLLKSALKNTFGNGTSNSGNIPDNRIRLAFQSMHDNGGFISSNGAKYLRLGATNSMKPFSGTHRTNFNTFIDGLDASNGTPSHDMMRNVFQYMHAPEHVSNPWADNPGTTQSTPYLACRRTYHVFMTDGAWNSQSNSDRVTKGDGVTQTLPDGTIYTHTANNSRVYKDSYGDNTSYASTLADYAFNNWSLDLQDGTAGSSVKNSSGTTITGNTQNMANSVRSLIKKAGAETYSTTTCTGAGNCIATPEYWNPKNDPASWQHITQYTIGFGIGAVNWPNTASTPVDWDNNNSALDNYAGDMPKLVQGEKSWPDVDVANSGTPDIRTIELWHMALNGRGKFYPVKTASALNAAFTEIMDTVIGDTSRPLVSIATSSSYLTSGLSAYIAGYSADRYSGSLSARPIDSVSGAIGATETWNAGTLLDAISTANLANRVVLSYSGTAGIAWKTYTSLPTAQKTPMNSNSAGTADSNGQNRVDYIRGDRTKELNVSGGIFRQRDSRLGDVVNSNIWYTGKPASGYGGTTYATFRGTGTGGMGGRTPMVYIGANDGMLHGFAAANWPNDTSPTIAGGKELLAYIPQAIAEGHLRKLTDTDYTHKYYVDGTPFSGDAYIGTTPTWKTVLVGTLGLGGKGYFLLDVTDPSAFTDANAASLVMKDTTATTDTDVGYITSPPVMDDSVSNKSRQIVKMNDDRWAVVFGNGYNSTNEAPVLLIQYLDGDKSIKKLSPCALTGTVPSATGTCSYKGTNGLSSPQLIDMNGDGKVDVAYAGDLQGNVWKFDLTDAISTNWKVSFSNPANPLGRPFFIAKQGTQPFTTAPYWMSHPRGGIMLAVATGRNVTDADQTDTTSTQSLYALWDNSSFSVASNVVTITDTIPINVASDTGIPSTLVQQTISSTAVVDAGKNYFSSSNNSVDYDTKKGWYLNWSLPAQRNVQNIRLLDGQKILVQTMIPKTAANANQETCSPSATAERSFLSVFNIFSGKPSAISAFSLVDTTIDSTSLTTYESNAGDTTIIRTSTKIKLLSSNCPVGQTCNSIDVSPSRFIGARGNWRQIQ